MATFEGYERREQKILGVIKQYGISSIDECKEITLAKGIDVDNRTDFSFPLEMTDRGGRMELCPIFIRHTAVGCHVSHDKSRFIYVSKIRQEFIRNSQMHHP